MKKCFAFAIGGIPDMFRHPIEFQHFMRRVTDEIKKCDGLVGLHPEETRADSCLVFYDTLNHAKVARNKLRALSVPCGTYIVNAEVSDDMSNAKLLEPAE